MVFQSYFGSDGVKVDKPGLEQRTGHLLQRVVHSPVQLDLVVQGAEDVGNSALFGEGRKNNFESAKVRLVKNRQRRPTCSGKKSGLTITKIVIYEQRVSPRLNYDTVDLLICDNIAGSQSGLSHIGTYT